MLWQFSLRWHAVDLGGWGVAVVLEKQPMDRKILLAFLSGWLDQSVILYVTVIGKSDVINTKQPIVAPIRR